MARFLIPLMALLLSACADLDRIEKGVIEPRVDEAVAEAVKRLCSLPVDVTKRAVEARTVPSWQSMADFCPNTWRAVRDGMRAE